MNRTPSPRCAIGLLGLFIAILALASAASANGKEKVLYSFQGYPDGDTPAGGVIFGRDGNLYGATQGGGNGAAPGAVFQLSKQGNTWKETLIYSFQGKANSDGDLATSGLVEDKDGNLYGTAGYGGAGHCIFFGSDAGCGLVYQLSPPKQKGGAWTETVIYSFQGDKDGDFPQGDLVFDSAGNLHGATQFGGGFGSCDPFYPFCGTIFELSPPKTKGGKWTEKVLYSFKNKKDGADPNGGLVLDKNGALCGTTYCGGNAECENLQSGYGVVFRLKPPVKPGNPWVYKVLHEFAGSPTDGKNPLAGLAFDSHGQLYGTTVGGGKPSGDGTVFELLRPSKGQRVWNEFLLHTFSGGNINGPMARVSFDSLGNIYGSAFEGGQGSGGIFELRNLGQRKRYVYNVVYSFAQQPDGILPESNLVFDDRGSLYGTTRAGGDGACQGGCGTVFEVSP